MTFILNFLLVGVGGQGTILASDILVNVGLKAGYQAKQAEVHGMSQRGGSVNSHVRWGEVVHSPLIGAGEVDILLAFEKVEALRYLNQLKRGGVIIVNWYSIEPVTVTSGVQKYPNDNDIRKKILEVTDKLFTVNGNKYADEMGNPRVANVFLLGVLSALIEKYNLVSSEFTNNVWNQILEQRVPAKYIDLNIQAFKIGRELVNNG